jgi:hypothetical protein
MELPAGLWSKENILVGVAWTPVAVWWLPLSKNTLAPTYKVEVKLRRLR